MAGLIRRMGDRLLGMVLPSVTAKACQAYQIDSCQMSSGTYATVCRGYWDSCSDTFYYTIHDAWGKLVAFNFGTCSCS